MIVRLTPVLLLLSAIVPSISPLDCPLLENANCKECPQPKKDTTDPNAPLLQCENDHWLINDNDVIKKEDLRCKNFAKAGEPDAPAWVTASNVKVKTVDCIKECYEKLDTTSIKQLIQPEVTGAKISCENSTHLIIESYSRRTNYFNKPINCDFQVGLWMSSTTEEIITPRMISTSDKIYCEAVGGLEEEEADSWEEEGWVDNSWPPWITPVIISIGTVVVLVASVPLSIYITKWRKRGPRRSMEAPNVKLWSNHWDVPHRYLNWNWKMVKDFCAGWDSYTDQEKVNFIEKGYMELGHNSTITQMLYIFEWMLEIEENHHHVWRPMYTFLIRLKRLATPPFSDPDTQYRFCSWLAWQGKKLIDDFGLLPNQSKIPITDDDHAPYFRFIGVFLMTLGNGARTKKMFEGLDTLFQRDGMDIPGPVRMAIAANRVARDGELVAFERVWDRLASTRANDEPGIWGSLQDQAMYALGWILDEVPTEMMTDYILKSRKLGARDIVHWFRGANDRGHHAHMAFIIKNADTLNKTGKMLVESQEMFNCIEMYCKFERSTLGWITVQNFVAKHPKLARRINVPAYRRRVRLFSSVYERGGEEELDAFLNDAHRSEEIEQADYVQPIVKPIGRPAGSTKQ